MQLSVDKNYVLGFIYLFFLGWGVGGGVVWGRGAAASLNTCSDFYDDILRYLYEKDTVKNPLHLLDNFLGKNHVT